MIAKTHIGFVLGAAVFFLILLIPFILFFFLFLIHFSVHRARCLSYHFGYDLDIFKIKVKVGWQVVKIRYVNILVFFVPFYFTTKIWTYFIIFNEYIGFGLLIGFVCYERKCWWKDKIQIGTMDYSVHVVFFRIGSQILCVHRECHT